ncbi:MAG: ornithine carbamoyltransferase [Verrucomicrobiae bacterium]|nr:ornithine carbamoyltransferase [Verrucomicrobiae bacterium]
MKLSHLLTLEEFPAEAFEPVFKLSAQLKKARGRAAGANALKGQTWGLVFTKSSTRTRVSFEVGVRELGGNALFLSGNDIQLGRGESIADTARVLSRFIHGVIIRTFEQEDLRQFAKWGSIPVINALTDDEHPCQILADLFTIREKRGKTGLKKLTFIGDGACNVPRSWLFAAAKLGFELAIGAPKKYQPDAGVLARAEKMAKRGFKYSASEDVIEASRGADVLYTDVWVSMGKEDEAGERLKELAGYQIHSKAVAAAKPNALVMHCLPAYRGKEITDEVFEANAQTIFDQAENRLHAQKAILTLVSKQRARR